MLFIMVCTLAAWLHLGCGLSHAAMDRMLRIVEIIVLLAVEIGQLAANLTTSLSQHPQSTPSTPVLSLPHGVHKAMSSLSIEPDIIRSICCPKCFAKYSLDSLPQVCLRRETH